MRALLTVLPEVFALGFLVPLRRCLDLHEMYWLKTVECCFVLCETLSDETPVKINEEHEKEVALEEYFLNLL